VVKEELMWGFSAKEDRLEEMFDIVVVLWMNPVEEHMRIGCLKSEGWKLKSTQGYRCVWYCDLGEYSSGCLGVEDLLMVISKCFLRRSKGCPSYILFPEEICFIFLHVPKHSRAFFERPTSKIATDAVRGERLLSGIILGGVGHMQARAGIVRAGSEHVRKHQCLDIIGFAMQACDRHRLTAVTAQDFFLEFRR
jgi:hypothetical protein